MKKIKVLGCEGMGDTGALYSYLGKPFIDKYPEIEYQHCRWQDWANYASQDWDICLGHSLGGQSVVDLCNWKKMHNMAQPKLLITLAPRYQSAASWLDFIIPLGLQGFTAPNNVTHNFWTLPPLPSQPMKGAIENTFVGFPYWHATICAAPAVHNCFSKFMDSANE